MIIVTRNAANGRDDTAARAILDAPSIVAAHRTIASWPGYAPTPLDERPGLAHALGVASLRIKREGERFDVASFKALGPPYALARALERRRAAGGRGNFTALAATSGNHGRALAWGARRSGVAARIYMAEHVSLPRAAAIAAFGAEIRRVGGGFDGALAACVAAAEEPGTILIADLPFLGSDAVARDTLSGYATLGLELVETFRRDPATHVFVAAGNGTLAAATASALQISLGTAAPRVITVEPIASDVIRRSINAATWCALDDAGESLMDGLVVGEPSRIAWPILAVRLDAAIAVGDDDALTMLRRLSAGADGDAALAVGETGIASIAGAVVAASDAAARRALDIDSTSRLVAIACEGVTDPDLFARLVARGQDAS